MASQGGSSLLSGFLKGMVQGKRMKQLDAQNMEEIDYKKRLLKNQEDAVKLKQEAQAKKQAGADQFMSMMMKLTQGPQTAPQTSAPQPPPPMPQQGGLNLRGPEVPAGGLTDQIARSQMQGQVKPQPGMSPMQMALMQGAGKQYGVDVDLLGAGKLAETRKGTALKEKKYGRGERVVGIGPSGQREFGYIKPDGSTEWTGTKAPDTRSVTNVNLGTKNIMEGAVKQLPKNREAALLAKSAVDRIDNALALVEKQGDNIAGWSGAFRRSFAPAAKFLGMDIESMTDAQILDNLLATGQGSLRMQVIGPGPVSDYEGQVLKEVSGRKMAAAEGIKRILEYQRGSQEQAIDTWNQDIDNISAVKGYELVKNIYKPIEYKKSKKEDPLGIR
jgi:hypothetical protein